MEPSSFMFVSPTRPFERFTMRIFRRSMRSRISNEECGWPMMFRMSGLLVNCPILFWMAGVASWV
jgi:hypothetical protein